MADWDISEGIRAPLMFNGGRIAFTTTVVERHSKQISTD